MTRVNGDLVIAIDRSDALPLHSQVAIELERAICDGRLTKGVYLPNEVDLAVAWHISRPTVRQAIKQLVDRGLLVRRRGVGTQVVSDGLRRPARLTSLYDDLVAAGRQPYTVVLELLIAGADAEVASALGVKLGEDVVQVSRCRLVGDKPLALMRNWLPVDVAAEVTVEQLQATGLYQLLRERGIKPHSAHQVIGAASANDHEAAALGLAPGSPLLTLRRVMSDASGRVAELGRHVYDAGHYALEITVLES